MKHTINLVKRNSYYFLFLFEPSLVILLFFTPGSDLKGQTCPGSSFFNYTGGNIDYATSNSNGWCYNGLTAGTAYCFSFTMPNPATTNVEMDWNTTGCAACPVSFYVSFTSSCGATSASCSGCGISSSSCCAIATDGSNDCDWTTYNP